MGEAERLKRNFGCALGRMVGDDEEIEVPGVGGHTPRKAPRRVLSDIIEPRVEEIFAVVRKRIEDTGLLEQLSAGVVLTGGAVLLEGMTEFAEEILGMPVRIGFPMGVRGITQLVHGPQYATGVGPREVRRAGDRRRARRGRDSRESDAHDRRGAPPKIERRAPESCRSRKAKFWEWLKAAF